MTELFIDREPAGLRESVQTWADLLTDVDRQLDGRGRVLTEVVFDGVGEPTYREPGSLARRLSTIGRIDLSTATPDALLRDCFRESAQSVRALMAECAGAARLLRTADVRRAYEHLAALATALGQLILLIRTLEGLDAAGDDGGTRTRLAELAQFGELLESVMSAQSSRDHFAVADILEYDLTPLLHAWETRFDARAA